MEPPLFNREFSTLDDDDILSRLVTWQCKLSSPSRPGSQTWSLLGLLDLFDYSIAGEDFAKDL